LYVLWDEMPRAYITARGFPLPFRFDTGGERLSNSHVVKRCRSENAPQYFT